MGYWGATDEGTGGDFTGQNYQQGGAWAGQANPRWQGKPGDNQAVVKTDDTKKKQDKKSFNPWWRKSMGYDKFTAPGGGPGGGGGGGGGGVGTGGKGGQGMVGALGDFTFDNFSYDPYSGAAMTPETYTADTYTANPLAQNYQYGDFSSPNEAVDFREFQAPTQQEAAADQGYQFRLAEGQRALENSAAAAGMLRTGNTWKDLQNYGQGAASQEYDKVYGRRMGEHGMAYQQALQTNQDQYGRAAQDWQMNRQNQADMYGRALTDDQRRMQAQQLTEDSRTRSQQLSEQSRFGAHAANLGTHQANYGMAAGAWDRNFGGNQAQYDYAMQRAMHESGMAESAAARAQSASAANARSAERQYDTLYNRALDEYIMGYDQHTAADQTEFNRMKWATELGLTTEQN